jgi:hypothetical protein
MSEPILVQPTDPEGHMPLCLVDGLIEDLKAEGLSSTSVSRTWRSEKGTLFCYL